jgi:hypothetical protein
MGLLFLTNLAEVCRRAMPYVTDVIEVDGWQKRARGSGGYPGRVKGRSAHHDAGSPLSDGWPAVNYETFIAAAKPISNVHLDRKAVCWIQAAGATNTIGKGGPMGDFAKDDGNAWQLGREEGNNGVGEPWPDLQVRAGIELDAHWYLEYGEQFGWRFPLDPVQFFEHRQWAPGRKIDRKGAARCVVDGIEYVFAEGYSYWNADLLLTCISRRIETLRSSNGGEPIVVPPTPIDPQRPPAPTYPDPGDDDDMATELLVFPSIENTVVRKLGNTLAYIKGGEASDVEHRTPGVIVRNMDVEAAAEDMPADWLFHQILQSCSTHSVPPPFVQRNGGLLLSWRKAGATDAARFGVLEQPSTGDGVTGTY